MSCVSTLLMFLNTVTLGLTLFCFILCQLFVDEGVCVFSCVLCLGFFLKQNANREVKLALH